MDERSSVMRLVLFLAVLLPAGAGAAAGGSFYCCESKDGRRVCGNPLPQACQGQAYRVLAADGTVLKQVAAPMSDEERARVEREERRKALEEERHRAQRLQDRALMDTYSNVEDIDTRERHAVDEFQRDLDKAKRRMEELQAEAARLGEESKLYPPNELPQDLRQAINDNIAEQSAQQTVIEAKQKGIEAVKARFQRDRERYKLLTEPARQSR